MPPAMLYAETLRNIGQITVSATQDNYSKVQITPDRKSLHLEANGEIIAVTFPCRISSTAVVDIPAGSPKGISWRMPIEGNQETSRPNVDSRNDDPFSASSLDEKTQIACISCMAKVLNTVKIWKDLPNEHWAEMMEFWHCHKPSHDDSTESLEVKNEYTAVEGVKAKPGVGLVDVCFLIVVEDDCCDLKIQHDQDVTCGSCGLTLGAYDRRFDGVRIWKWAVSISDARGPSWGNNPLQSFVSARLLQLIESQASRKFMAYSGNLKDCPEGLLLWVFTPDLHYSSSIIFSGQPRRAMKVLYQQVQKPSEMVARMSMSLEDLQVHHSVLKQLQADLDASNTIIPESARRLRHWHVGLLERFET